MRLATPLALEVALLASATVAAAAPFDPAVVPGDAAYVAHVDVDAARLTRLAGVLPPDGPMTGTVRAEIDKMEQAVGTPLARGLHGLTAFGDNSADRPTVVVDLAVDRPKLLDWMHNSGWTEEAYHGHALLSAGETAWCGLHDGDGRIVIAPTRGRAEAELDLLDGHRPATRPGRSLPPATRPAPIVYAAAVNPPADVAGPPPAVVTVATVGVTEVGDAERVELRATAATPADAERAAGHLAELIAHLPATAGLPPPAMAVHDRDVVGTWTIPIAAIARLDAPTTRPAEGP